MLTAAEIVRSTYGVWRLAHVDPAGMSYFDATPDGFWRSFRVAILIAPAYALLVWFDYAVPPADAETAQAAAGAAGGAGRILAVELITYAISWMAYPLAVHFLVTALGREREYVGYIVAYNWSSVLQIGVLLPIVAIGTWELLPAPLGSILGVAVAIALLAFSWFIARTALKTGALPAAGLVAMDVMISILISGIKDAMIH